MQIFPTQHLFLVHMYISACTEMDWNQMNEVTQPKITIARSASSEPDDFIKDQDTYACL